jgi:hypothetical protein
MYVVLDGSVDVIRQGPGEAEHLLATLGPGDAFGELGFLGAFERSASIRSKSDVELLALNSKTTRRALMLYPFISAKLNLSIARILGKRYIEHLGTK